MPQVNAMVVAPAGADGAGARASLSSRSCGTYDSGLGKRSAPEKL